MTLGILAIAASTFACAASFSPSWSPQDGLSLATSKAEARVRVYIRTGCAANANYYTADGLPWYAVRAYYFGGPWSGPGYSYTVWSDHAARNGFRLHARHRDQGRRRHHV
jgi:hypothetical protein